MSRDADCDGNVTLQKLEAKKTEAKKKNPQPPTGAGARALFPGPGFADFWAAYPRKVGKPGAERAWVKHGCEPIAAELMAGLVRWKISAQWTKDGGEFIPYPATWLNRRGWEDIPQPDVPTATRYREMTPEEWLAERERRRKDGSGSLQTHR